MTQPRIGPCRDPLRLWYLETRTPGGGTFRRYFADRAAARQARKDLQLERHRAADPHCTCNDCVDVHFGEVPRGPV